MTVRIKVKDQNGVWLDAVRDSDCYIGINAPDGEGPERINYLGENYEFFKSVYTDGGINTLWYKLGTKSRVELFCNPEINLTEYDYFRELILDKSFFHSEKFTLFNSSTIRDAIVAKNGEFKTKCGLSSERYRSGDDIHMLVTPVFVVVEEFPDGLSYSICTVDDSGVTRIAISNDKITESLLNQFSLEVPEVNKGKLC